MAATGPRKVCFMVMPYGSRPTGSDDPNAPAVVDFDRLWEQAYEPAFRELGYEPVRADMDVGALIIKEMLERLVIAHLVCADISIPNGNVYYEIGIRHAAQEDGCVMLAADWARPLFDIDQMPRLAYPLPDGSVPDADAATIREILVKSIPALAFGTSPVFQAVAGYPNAEVGSAESFKSFVRELSTLQGKVRAAREAAPSKRAEKALALVDEVTSGGDPPPSVCFELLFLLRDIVDWGETKRYIERLPAPMQALPIVREQLALAQSKTGDHDEAVEGLEALIELAGETSERRGLLGGRYKKLMLAAESDEDRRHYLGKAIESYQRGADLDLNDYYPTSNLARLYRTRGEPGDEKRAQSAAAITLAAVRRAKTRDPDDPWIRPTLLGAAFDDGDVETVRGLCEEIRREGAKEWQLKTTLEDLKVAVARLADEDARRELQLVIDDLGKMAG